MAILVKEVTVPVIDCIEEARELDAMVRDNAFDHLDGERDAVNGALEAFAVGYLRDASKEDLLNSLNDLKQLFSGRSFFKRAVARVQAFRGKNAAWKTFTLETNTVEAPSDVAA